MWEHALLGQAHRHVHGLGRGEGGKLGQATWLESCEAGGHHSPPMELEANTHTAGKLTSGQRRITVFVSNNRQRDPLGPAVLYCELVRACVCMCARVFVLACKRAHLHCLPLTTLPSASAAAPPPPRHTIIDTYPCHTQCRGRAVL